MPWTRRKVANLGSVTLNSNYTAADGSMTFTAGDGSFLPTTGIFWLQWNDGSGNKHLFRVSSMSGDVATLTAETSEGAGDTNITAGQTLNVVTTISAIEMMGMVFLQQQVASASASLDFASTISATYDEYRIELQDIVLATSTDHLYLRMSTDGGSSYDSGTNYDTGGIGYRSGGAGFFGAASGLTGIIVYNAFVSQVGPISGSLTLATPSNASAHKQVFGQTSAEDATSRLAESMGGAYRSNTAVNAFQIIASTGNITSGTVRAYGLSKT